MCNFDVANFAPILQKVVFCNVNFVAVAFKIRAIFPKTMVAKGVKNVAPTLVHKQIVRYFHSCAVNGKYRVAQHVANGS